MFMFRRVPSQTLLVVVPLAGLALVVGCDTKETDVRTTPRAATAEKTDATATAVVDSSPQSPTASSPQSRPPRPVELAQQDLAQKLDIALSSIDVLQTKDVMWPDKCLGLPAPELCAPGETLGYRVTLEALGQEYVYHTDQAESFRYAGPGDAPQRP